MSFSKTRPLVLVGAGKMGGAMLAGWIASGTDPDSILVIDPKPSDELLAMASDKGFRKETKVPEGVTAGVLLLALKPQMMAEALDALKPAADADTLVISVAAGTPASVFEEAFGDAAVVRVMPNTPAQVGRGMSVAFANARTSDAQRETVRPLSRRHVVVSVWLFEPILVHHDRLIPRCHDSLPSALPSTITFRSTAIYFLEVF